MHRTFVFITQLHREPGEHNESTMHLPALLISLAPYFSRVVAQDTSCMRITHHWCVCANTCTAVTATSTFAPLLSTHVGTNEECPQLALLSVHYYNDDNVGCCTQSAVLTAVAGGRLACCGCGAACTGSVPSMADWTISAGELFWSPSDSSISCTGIIIFPLLTSTALAGQFTTSAGTTSVSTSSSITACTQPTRTSSPSSPPTASPAPGEAEPLHFGYALAISGLFTGVLWTLL
jgi:hypothetical protein